MLIIEPAAAAIIPAVEEPSQVTARLDDARNALQKSDAEVGATKGPVNVFKEGDKVISLDGNKDLIVTHQKGYKVFCKGRTEWVHANRLKLASGKAPTREVMDDAGEGKTDEGEDFDAEAEFDACEPWTDEEEVA